MISDWCLETWVGRLVWENLHAFAVTSNVRREKKIQVFLVVAFARRAVYVGLS